MKHELNIDKMSPQELWDHFKKNEPEKGDELHLKSSQDLHSVILIVISALIPVVIYLLSREKRKKEGAEKLQEVFDKTSLEELEELMEEEYGIRLSLEKQDPEEGFRKDWYEISQEGLSGAWDDDEPDISQIPIQEPNPSYDPKRWKKDNS